MWYVYIIECKNKSLYTGIAKDLKRRLSQHKRGKGSRYVRSFGFKKLVYLKRCPSKPAALKREWNIKQLNRNKKIDLIKGQTSLVLSG